MLQEAKAFLTHNLITFAPIQDVLNARANKNDVVDWRENHNNWSRAIFQEAAEMQNHVGWTWWRNNEAFINRAFMELVDIQHFWLSAILQTGKKDWEGAATATEVTVHSIQRLKKNNSGKGLINNMIDLLIEISAKNSVEMACRSTGDYRVEQNLLDMGVVIQELVVLCGKTNADLYAWYAGKSSLNLFRYDNGYKVKDGGYIKEWAPGEEDNDFLEKLILGAGCEHTTEGFYNALAEKYSEIKGGVGVNKWRDSQSKVLIDTRKS
ncbi:dUTP diphosphatase [Acetobacter persici]|uniref:dUTPase n=1 Tax=Acetobacter persici TaxID=1076596 RepID=A0A1U9LJC8_9PROT|nr:dUTP diphosphatase [Acetobacter persici]AQT06531.1 hypothetical protein A0U91_16110 [Acetobacter persici]